MAGLEEFTGEDAFFASADPIVIELNWLHNQLKDKDRELVVAYGEMKTLRVTEHLKEKAIEELTNELERMDEKQRAIENLLKDKNLEIKKLSTEKKEAMAAQFAAEATLRRVHAAQRDEDCVPIEALIAPMESEIKIYKNEIAMLQEDKKALERLTKSKELALVESEKILKSAMERALIVEDVQNQNLELRRQIEIYQEENRILDKTNRQKVVEVEKLGQTIRELEESILEGGVAANAIRDYQRQISELNEERRTLERELARVKVSANRVATVVANEWKDDNDKVMPVKQWLQERKFLQGELQRLRDKLVVSERTAKAEAQLKDKLKLRIKTLEDGLRQVSSFSGHSNASLCPQETTKSDHVLGFLSNNMGPKKRSSSQPRASSLAINKISSLQQSNVVSKASNAVEYLKRSDSLKARFIGGENVIKKKLWASRSKLHDDCGKENSENKAILNVGFDDFVCREELVSGEISVKSISNKDLESQNKSSDLGSDDLVSGFLYDRLQREVLNLRKSCQEKDGIMNVKEEEIKMLIKKVDALTKSMEIESKKMKREVAARDREIASVQIEKDNKQKPRSTSTPRRIVKHLEASAKSRN